MDFYTEYDRCAPWIEAALARTGETPTHTVDDIRAAVLVGRMQFWPAEKSVAITETAVYPRLTAVRVFLAAGDLADLREVEKSICDWARHINATRVEICGRPGWERALEGYSRASVWLTKELNE